MYVVRIYRREAGTVSGIVEDAWHGRSQSFHSAAEMTALILGQDDDAKKITSTKEEPNF